jgi:hypothetical protein
MPLDPLTALSVASSVIQLVDFSLKIVSKSKDLYKSNNGTLKENAATETVTIRLKQMTSRLRGQLGRNSNGIRNGTYDQARQDRLMDICKECSEVSDELIHHLGKLKVPTWSEKSKWKSFRQALKSIWSKPAIDEMAKRLEVLRAELDTHILEILRFVTSYREGVCSILTQHVSQKVDNLSIQQHTRFAKLDENTRAIIESILKANTETEEYLRSSFESLRESAKAEHMKTRAAFVAMDGEKRRVRIDLAFLESLRFHEMNYRYERVADAHKKTFLWAFRDPRRHEKPWDNFVEWLSESNGIYWIQGKAASGKSTLMRFIWDNYLTRCNLDLWSGNSQLVVAAFFFWNSGVPQQRSQLGLLQSLLFSALQNRRSLISQVFPEEWRNKSELVANDLAIGTITWSLVQLQRAFARLIECASQQLKMCFFVDGLDEYEGDPEEIALYFKDLSMISEHAKFCLSSRPWPIFQDIYQDTPGLKVQDMTHDDIKLYVEDNLERNRNMQDLLDEDPQGSSGLIKELVNKADGVFLWVVLVVKSLISGLRNGDGIVHLRRRLEAIPAGIEELYDHMLKRIHPLDLEEASQIFQIFRKSGHDLDLATLQRALTFKFSDYQTVIDTEPATNQDTVADRAKYKARLKRMNARLNSRCKGLLEALKHEPTPLPETAIHSEDASKENSYVSNGQKNKKRKREESQHLTPDGGFYHSEKITSDVPTTALPVVWHGSDLKVSPHSKRFESSEEVGSELELLKIFFLHRTVRDYLEQPKVWDRLLDRTRLTDFDPCGALLMSYITELKTTDSSQLTLNEMFVRDSQFEVKLHRLELPASEPCLSLQSELNRVIGLHWWGETIMVASPSGLWSCDIPDAGWHDPESGFPATSQGDESLFESCFPMTSQEDDFNLDNWHVSSATNTWRRDMNEDVENA